MNGRQLSLRAVETFWDVVEARQPCDTGLYSYENGARIADVNSLLWMAVWDDLREAINNINHWATQLAAWSAWIEALSRFDDEQERWTIAYSSSIHSSFTACFSRHRPATVSSLSPGLRFTKETS